MANPLAPRFSEWCELRDLEREGSDRNATDTEKFRGRRASEYLDQVVQVSSAPLGLRRVLHDVSREDGKPVWYHELVVGLAVTRGGDIRAVGADLDPSLFLGLYGVCSEKRLWSTGNHAGSPCPACLCAKVRAGKASDAETKMLGGYTDEVRPPEKIRIDAGLRSHTVFELKIRRKIDPADLCICQGSRLKGIGRAKLAALVGVWHACSDGRIPGPAELVRCVYPGCTRVAKDLRP